MGRRKAHRPRTKRRRKGKAFAHVYLTGATLVYSEADNPVSGLPGPAAPASTR